MIPGHPVKTTYRTIAFDDFGVFMCGSMEGCAKDFGWRAHRVGKVDRAGTIHWDAADKRASKRGMRNLMKLMALDFHREWWSEPKWKQLYLTNVWATNTIRDRYHYRVKRAWSFKDRRLALEMARRSRKTGSLRWQHRKVYKWILDAGLLGGKAVQSQSHMGDPQDD